MESDSKVLFRLNNEDGTADVETLWATKLEGDQYRLNNSPFYAYGVSWKDIVSAPYDEDEQFPTFKHVVSKSGHKTIRIIFDPPVQDGNESDRLMQGLVKLGCSYEGANPSYMSIDIPPEIELQVIREFLVSNHANWEHADPRYKDLFPEDD